MNKKVLVTSILTIVVVAAGTMFWSKGSKKVTGDMETIKVVDSDGEKEVKKNPTKVAVFDYGTLDILDSMEVEVVGLPKGSLPASLKKYETDKYKDLGDLKEPNFEDINALKPDLIIIGGRQKDLQEKFSEIAPTIYLSVDGAKYMEDFEKNLNALGTIFGKEDFVKTKLSEIEGRIKNVNKKVSEKSLTASTVMVNEGSLSAFSDKSRFGLIYNNLGFKNVDDKLEASNHGNQITFEYLLEKNPEYIFVIDRGAVTGGNEAAKAAFDNALVKETKAYSEDKIIYLDSEAWYLIAGGVNSTEKMIEEIENSIK